VEGTEVQIYGHMATLVNLSVVGAQVCSLVALRPKQRVTLVFADGGQSMRVQSVIATVSVEIANGTTRYRAGVEFLDVDQSAVQRLIDSKKK
jgi:PilZ domain